MTGDEVIRMAREASCSGDGSELSGDAIERFASLVRNQALEESARIVEHQRVAYNWNEREALAKAIRALKTEEVHLTAPGPMEASTGEPQEDLRYIQRVLESDAPKEDRERAAQMVRAMRCAGSVPGSVTEAMYWLRAALQCSSFHWDRDQREYAEAALQASLRWLDIAAQNRKSQSGAKKQDHPESESGGSIGAIGRDASKENGNG